MSIGDARFRVDGPCPRCTVPCRDGHSGGFLFPAHKLKLWDVLKRAFPGKFGDPEWGSWAGAFFGVYFGHAGAEGATLSVGDAIVVRETTSWDAHLQRPLLARAAAALWAWAAWLAAAVAAVALAVGVAGMNAPAFAEG